MKWVTHVPLLLIAMSAFLASACSGNSAPPPAPSSNSSDKVTTDQDSGPATAPSKMTEVECKANGTVVYDMGDGRTHSASYRCANGKSPIGFIPVGREGAVCCPK